VTNFIIMLVSASENVCPTPGCFTVLTDTAWDISTNTSTLYCTVNSSWRSWHGFRQHLQRLWRPLPTSVVLVLFVFLRWRYVRQTEASTDSKTVIMAKNWEVSKFTFLINSCFIGLRQVAIRPWKHMT
jgi:H+/Cl- antiporter ClcA